MTRASPRRVPAWLAPLLLAPFLLAPGAPAQDAGPREGSVRLSAGGGGFAVEGTILGFDGAFYRIETEGGPVTVDAARVECAGDCPDPDLAQVAISGEAEAVEDLMPALMRAYAAEKGMEVEAGEGRLTLLEAGREALAVFLRGTGTEEGFADLLAGEADMVLAGRPVRPLEAALAGDAGLGDLTDPMRALVLAPGALAVVVAPDSPVRALTLPQLAAVFSGALGSWAELGLGGDDPVRLHLPGEGTAAAQGFADAVMDPAGLPIAEEGIVRHASSEALATAIAADADAIGVVPAEAIGGARALDLGGVCAPPGGPSAFAVASGDYPLAQPVLLYLPARRLPNAARDFAAWLATPEAEAAALSAGFGAAAGPVPFDAQARRLAAGVAAADEATLPALRDAVAALEGHARRPETFRFEDGTARLDAAGESAARRLAARLRTGGFEGRRLLFAGFSDARGEAELRLSRLRAGVVRDHVADLAGGSAGAALRAAGFGAALPVACSDTVWGRKANRRVELWIEEDASGRGG